MFVSYLFGVSSQRLCTLLPSLYSRNPLLDRTNLLPIFIQSTLEKMMPHHETTEQPQHPLVNQSIADSSPDQHNDVSTVYWRPAIFCTLIYLLMGIGYFISAAPQLRLLESIICQQYYEGSESSASEAGIPEHLCKEGPVQAALAQLLGWQSFFDNIPGLLLTLPYGILADKYGRRLIMTLSFVGQFVGMSWVLIVCR